MDRLTNKQREQVNKRKVKPKSDYRRNQRTNLTKYLYCSNLILRNHWLLKEGFDLQDVIFLASCDCLQDSFGYFSINGLRNGTYFNYNTTYKRLRKFMKYGLIDVDSSIRDVSGKRYYLTMLARDVLKSFARVVNHYLDYGKATYEIRMIEDNPKGGYATRPSVSGSTDNG